ncbi:nucleoside deaminase [Parapedobacter sp. DT-150]|uniref:nucleoside deaminase n=1 Tax=Parapedobacter sp. DT-150 TaxID=3396162 RepID=UPI003F1A6110
MVTKDDVSFLTQAVELALSGAKQGAGGPFGCIIVKNGNIVGQGYNRVTSDNDPTAHAEIVAIREACRQLRSFQLDGCTVYASCEPCPMCLGAIYWARPERVVYAATRFVAADAGFDDQFIYTELNLPEAERKIPFIHCPDERFLTPFEYWKQQGDKTLY